MALSSFIVYAYNSTYAGSICKSLSIRFVILWKHNLQSCRKLRRQCNYPNQYNIYYSSKQKMLYSIISEKNKYRCLENTDDQSYPYLFSKRIFYSFSINPDLVLKNPTNTCPFPLSTRKRGTCARFNLYS